MFGRSWFTVVSLSLIFPGEKLNKRIDRGYWGPS